MSGTAPGTTDAEMNAIDMLFVPESVQVREGPEIKQVSTCVITDLGKNYGRKTQDVLRTMLSQERSLL